jgi:hypothetical protein
MTEVTELIKEYEQQATVKELAQRFGIHRLTVSALLKRHGIELRPIGLTDEQVADACHLYPAGRSLARHRRAVAAQSMPCHGLRTESVPQRCHNGPFEPAVDSI